MLRIIHFLFAILFTISLSAQLRIRVMHHNLLSFGPQCDNVTITNKYNWLGTVLDHYRPHLFTVNELGPNIAYSNGIKALSFDYTDNIEYADLTNNANSNFVNQLFYDKDVFVYTGVEVLGNFLRDINVYHLYVKPTAENPALDTVFLDCIVAHLKAGDSPSDANTRANMAQSIMNYIQAKGIGKNILVMGDFNLYSHTEAAFQTMVFNANNTLNLKDPANKQNGWNGSTHAIVHTQSSRASSPDCGSGGGMDDRFDFILTSVGVMDDTAGIGYVANSYAAFGNGGNSYNQELTCSNNGPIPASVCGAMKLLSDHLPVVMELEVDGVTRLEGNHLTDVEVNILPRPMEEKIILNLKMNTSHPGNLLVDIFNPGGQVVSQAQISPRSQEAVLPAAHLSSGIYMIRIMDSSGKFFSKSFLWHN